MAWAVVTLVFVVVTMAMALVGNSLVLVILGCRWRAKTASQVYILYLAALDFLCALVSTPREVMTWHAGYRGWNKSLSEAYLEAVHVWCGLSTYLTYILNYASALVLVFIALTRYRKCSRLAPDQGQGQGQGQSRVRRTAQAALDSLASARGARVWSGWGLGACMVVCVPVLISLHRDPTRHGGCLHNIGPTFWSFVKPMQYAFFTIFLAQAVLLLVLYSLVLYHVRGNNRYLQQQKTEGRELSGRRYRRDSVLFYTQLSGDSIGSLLDVSSGSSDVSAGRKVARTRSDGDDTVTTRSGDEGAGAAFQRSFSSPSEEVRTNGHLGALGRGRRSRGESESSPDLLKELQNKRLSFLPPLSYSAQMRSNIHLNMDRPASSPEKSDDAQSKRLSTTSLQFTKSGNSTTQTTAIFVIITTIYILSYLPFFIVELFVSHELPAAQLLLRSYLISNAFNPLVYVLCNPHFRSALLKILRCRREVI